MPPLPRSTPAATGAFSAAGGLGGAAVDGHIRQVQADHLVVGVQCGQPQPIEDAQPDPFVAAAAQGGRRAGGIGDPLVAGAVHQRLDQLVEDHRIVDAGAVAVQRMSLHTRRQQGEELLAQRVKDAGWDGRHEASTVHGALAPSRAWPSCLPHQRSHPDWLNPDPRVEAKLSDEYLTWADVIVGGSGTAPAPSSRRRTNAGSPLTWAGREHPRRRSEPQRSLQGWARAPSRITAGRTHGSDFASALAVSDRWPLRPQRGVGWPFAIRGRRYRAPEYRHSRRAAGR